MPDGTEKSSSVVVSLVVAHVASLRAGNILARRSRIRRVIGSCADVPVVDPVGISCSVSSARSDFSITSARLTNRAVSVRILSYALSHSICRAFWSRSSLHSLSSMSLIRFALENHIVPPFVVNFWRVLALPHPRRQPNPTRNRVLIVVGPVEKWKSAKTLLENQVADRFCGVLKVPTGLVLVVVEQSGDLLCDLEFT